MPQSDRPSSPDDPISDQYNIHRLEHDLFELFEEQQMLLDIVSQQQERLDHQRELQLLVLSEPPVRMATPLPEEILLEESDEDSPVMELSETEAQLQPELMDIVEGEELHLEKQALLLSPARWTCVQYGQQHQEIQDKSGATCTPPKLTGLGYDSPFSYPKRMAKGRYRRALFIFTLVDKLALQLQRIMALNKNNVCFPRSQRPSFFIEELPKEIFTPTRTVTVTGITTLISNMIPIEAKSTSKTELTFMATGALPKPKRNINEHNIKGLTKQSTSHRKRMRKSTQLDQELDMDCEFGMDYIQKFRLNRLREDCMDIEPMNNNCSLSEQLSCGLPQNDCMTAPLGHVRIDEEEFSECMSDICMMDSGLKSQELSMNDISAWQDTGIYCSGSQQDTRPCTPDLLPEKYNSCSLLPAVLEKNGFINLMPSTSSQARAMALSMCQQGRSCVSFSPHSSRRSSIRHYQEYTPPTTPPIASDQCPSMQMEIFNIPYMLSSQQGPPPPPPTPLFNNNFNYGNNDFLANRSHDACAEDYSAFSSRFL